MNIPTKVLTMATSKMMRRTICAYLIKNNKNSWMVFSKTCNYTAPNFFCRTLASHSIPATDMPSSNTTVITPTILMSFSSSTMMALLSWMRCKIYPNYTHDQMFPGETFSTWSSAIMSNFTHLQQFNHSLCKSHHIHGDSHSIGKGKNQPNGATKLRS